MPELPEVEVVRAGLQPVVTGALVTGVEVLEPRSLRRHPPGVTDFETRLVGRRIRAAVRRGKFLWFPLDGRTGAAEALLAHLGMSGQMLLRTEDADADRLMRVRVTLESPAHGPLAIAFVDQRIFGSLAIDRLVATPDGAAGGLGGPEPLVPEHVAHIARDPLDPAFQDAAFSARLRARRTGLKRALLDQTLISGVGNIYADEALWAARMHAETPTGSLTEGDVALLLDELRLVLERALADGGTSFDAQYVDVNGASGYFSQRLNVYGRQGRPCPRCGTAIVRESFMSRSSHTCPLCQVRPADSVTARRATRDQAASSEPR